MQRRHSKRPSDYRKERFSFTEKALKKARSDYCEKDITSSDMDLRFNLPTSKVCKRLFSVAGLVMGNGRKIPGAQRTELDFQVIKISSIGAFVLKNTFFALHVLATRKDIFIFYFSHDWIY